MVKCTPMETTTTTAEERIGQAATCGHCGADEVIACHGEDGTLVVCAVCGRVSGPER